LLPELLLAKRKNFQYIKPLEGSNYLEGMMRRNQTEKMRISHRREDETPEAKARWFQSLTLEERMDLLCAYTDLILQVNPKIAESKDAPSTSGRVQVLKLP